MEFHTKIYQTPNGIVEGVQVKWTGFNILLAAGTKGFIACPAIDLDACERFGVAAASRLVGTRLRILSERSSDSAIEKLPPLTSRPCSWD